MWKFPLLFSTNYVLLCNYTIFVSVMIFPGIVTSIFN
jgi:hypothetical protein